MNDGHKEGVFGNDDLMLIVARHVFTACRILYNGNDHVNDARVSCKPLQKAFEHHITGLAITSPEQLLCFPKGSKLTWLRVHQMPLSEMSIMLGAFAVHPPDRLKDVRVLYVVIDRMIGAEVVQRINCVFPNLECLHLTQHYNLMSETVMRQLPNRMDIRLSMPQGLMFPRTVFVELVQKTLTSLELEEQVLLPDEWLVLTQMTALRHVAVGRFEPMHDPIAGQPCSWETLSLQRLTDDEYIDDSLLRMPIHPGVKLTLRNAHSVREKVSAEVAARLASCLVRMPLPLTVTTGGDISEMSKVFKLDSVFGEQTIQLRYHNRFISMEDFNGLKRAFPDVCELHFDECGIEEEVWWVLPHLENLEILELRLSDETSGVPRPFSEKGCKWIVLAMKAWIKEWIRIIEDRQEEDDSDPIRIVRLSIRGNGNDDELDEDEYIKGKKVKIYLCHEYEEDG